MSSNIKVLKICEYCKNEFVARKTTSQTCSDVCANRFYKLKQLDSKIAQAELETEIKRRPYATRKYKITIMNLRITLEWSLDTGLTIDSLYVLRDAIEQKMQLKDYGQSLSNISTILICRPFDFKQRLRFKKDLKRMDYDILVDFTLMKNASIEEKKVIVQKEIIGTTERVLSKYNFDDFDTSSFLMDLRDVIMATKW